MDMNGSQTIAATREAVYAALNDVDILRQCIPGCDSIEKTSDTEMNAKVTLRVGPVKASFSGKVTLSDLDPPNGYTISGEGSGGVAGFAKGGAQVRLEADGNSTILHYTVKAEIGGKLAQLGSRLIDATATKLAGDFFTKFGVIAGGPSDGAAAEPTKKGWLGQAVSKAIGTITAAMVVLSLSSSWCCLNGHQHEFDDPLSMSICVSRS